VPVLVAGRITDPAVADSIVQSGKADVVHLGRQSLADPDWPKKVQSGQEQTIVKCLSCNEGCIGRDSSVAEARHNVRAEPAGGEGRPIREAQRRQAQESDGRWAGPAGLEAARSAALRGHTVALYETEPSLGGRSSWWRCRRIRRYTGRWPVQE